MRSLHPALAARLAALQQYKIKHAALEKMDDLVIYHISCVGFSYNLPRGSAL
jgi:hypothetical protein